MSGLVLIATIGEQHIAIDATRIDAVVDLQRITPVPRAPRHVLGLSAVRSRVVTVIDSLGDRRGDQQTPLRAVVIEDEGHLYALAVDRVIDAAVCQQAFNAISLPATSPWRNVEPMAAETQHGLVLLVDPSRMVAGDLLAPAIA